MSQIFLTSSISGVAHDIAPKIDAKKRHNMVFITTPTEPETESLDWLKKDENALIEAGFEYTKYTITGKDEKTVKNDLANFDIIFMSGGYTDYLAKMSEECNLKNILHDLIYEKSKIYIGCSAGSIICGPNVPYYLWDEDKSYSGFDFVNFTLIPHWGSKDFREMYLSERLNIAYDSVPQPLIMLRDNQYIEIFDDNMKIFSL